MGDDDDAERASTAADEPTAAWSADDLLAAGLAAGLEDASNGSRESAPAATTPAPDPTSRGSIEVASQAPEAVRQPFSGSGYSYPKVQPDSTIPPRAQGLSWPMTIAFAIVAGVLVYLLVSALR